MSPSAYTDMKNKAANLLLELLLCIIIFTLCAYICVSLFLKASSKSKEAALLCEGVLACRNVAEEIKALGNASSRNEGELSIEVEKTADEYLISAFDASGKIIYQLKVRPLYE